MDENVLYLDIYGGIHNIRTFTKILHLDNLGKLRSYHDC